MVLLHLLLPGRADGQACLGNEGISVARLRIGSSIDLGDHYKTFLAEVSVRDGGKWLYAVTAGFTTLEFGPRVDVAFGGSLGFAGLRALGGRARVCLQASILHDRTFDTATDFRIGAVASYPIGNAEGRLAKALAVGASFGVEHYAWYYNVWPAPNDWFGTLDLGLALHLGQRLVAVPGIRAYVFADNGRRPSLILKAGVVW